MGPTIGEFIDTYSDDVIYLREARKALLTHPLRREIRPLCDAAFCRMFAVIMIGNIEMMLEEWRRRKKGSLLNTYFSRKKDVPNGERVNSLYNAFRKNGIKVEKNVFDDYLAIKYLRNTIVHAGWKTGQKEWIQKRAFPADTRELTYKHWRKMQSVNNKMMFYIFLSEFADLKNIRPPREVVRVQEADEGEDLGLIRKNAIPTIFWSNMERVTERILTDVEKAAIAEEYRWNKGLTKKNVEQMDEWEMNRLFYLAARRAAKDGFDSLVQHEELGKVSLESWQEYWHLRFEKLEISHQDILKATEILRTLNKRGIYQKGPHTPLPKNPPQQLVDYLFEGYEPLTAADIGFAYDTGKKVYDLMPNITPVLLFVVLFPIVDPESTKIYLEEGQRALAAMELRDYWYSYVEYRSPPDVQRWAFYRNLMEEFLRS